MSDTLDRSASDQPAAAPRADRFTFVWFLVFCLYFLLFAYSSELDRIFHLWMLVIPLLLLPAAAIVICWLVFLVINAVRRRWRRLGSQVVAPVLAFALFALLFAIGATPDRIRFELNRGWYEAEIARLPQTGAPRFHKWDWGYSGGVPGPDISYTLVFDESDEIVRPPEQRSVGWQKRMTPQMCPKDWSSCPIYESGGAKSVTVEKISGHFFLVTELN